MRAFRCASLPLATTEAGFTADFDSQNVNLTGRSTLFRRRISAPASKNVQGVLTNPELSGSSSSGCHEGFRVHSQLSFRASARISCKVSLAQPEISFSWRPGGLEKLQPIRMCWPASPWQIRTAIYKKPSRVSAHAVLAVALTYAIETQ